MDMQSTIPKIEYLDDTKDLIKQALIEKGVEVADTDTFRSYADKIGDINTAKVPYVFAMLLAQFTLPNTNMGALAYETLSNFFQGPFDDDFFKFVNQIDFEVYLNNPAFTGQSINFFSFLKGQTLITKAPNIGTKYVINFNNMFNGCTALVDVPVYDFSNAGKNMSNIGDTFKTMFSNCPNLSDESLNNIMYSLANATYYNQNATAAQKQLMQMGFSSNQRNKMATLENYSLIENAGWVTEIST